jgi:hypothetical protein
VRRLVLLLPLLALAGCGGGHSDPIAKGDAICKDIEKQVLALKRPATLGQVRGYVARSTQIAREGVAKLRALDVPARKRAALNEYLGIAQQVIDLSTQSGAAALAGDAGRQQQLTAQAAQLRPRATAAARRVGFTSCSQ